MPVIFWLAAIDAGKIAWPIAFGGAAQLIMGNAAMGLRTAWIGKGVEESG